MTGECGADIGADDGFEEAGESGGADGDHNDEEISDVEEEDRPTMMFQCMCIAAWFVLGTYEDMSDARAVSPAVKCMLCLNRHHDARFNRLVPAPTLQHLAVPVPMLDPLKVCFCTSCVESMCFVSTRVHASANHVL